MKVEKFITLIKYQLLGRKIIYIWVQYFMQCRSNLSNITQEIIIRIIITITQELAHAMQVHLPCMYQIN